jgi:hypothetical protein
MIASILDVFEACSRASNVPFQARRSRAKCPFHHGSTYSLSINDEKGAWHCFVAHCPYPKGGILDVPIAFGLCVDRSEASQWLARRGIIPVAQKQPDTPQPVIQPRLYVNPNHLLPRQRACYYEAHLNLIRQIGEHRYRELRCLNGPYHYRRQKDLEKAEDKLVELFGAWIGELSETLNQQTA